mmetsp:Transcript_2834/g.6930  ORF Transcript_2834/g.6930 Transcript_2834/m.6930 type:complete len:281 (+) Transcript_2834:279-1121(+)
MESNQGWTTACCPTVGGDPRGRIKLFLVLLGVRRELLQGGRGRHNVSRRVHNGGVDQVSTTVNGHGSPEQGSEEACQKFSGSGDSAICRVDEQPVSGLECQSLAQGKSIGGDLVLSELPGLKAVCRCLDEERMVAVHLDRLGILAKVASVVNHAISQAMDAMQAFNWICVKKSLNRRKLEGVERPGPVRMPTLILQSWHDLTQFVNPGWRRKLILILEAKENAVWLDCVNAVLDNFLARFARDIAQHDRRPCRSQLQDRVHCWVVNPNKQSGSRNETQFP